MKTATAPNDEVLTLAEIGNRLKAKELLATSSRVFDDRIALLKDHRKVTFSELKEIKRQRRIIRNRESAFESRKRRNAELKERASELEQLRKDNKRLQQTIAHLQNEVALLRSELLHQRPCPDTNHIREPHDCHEQCIIPGCASECRDHSEVACPTHQHRVLHDCGTHDNDPSCGMTCGEEGCLEECIIPGTVAHDRHVCCIPGTSGYHDAQCLFEQAHCGNDCGCEDIMNDLFPSGVENTYSVIPPPIPAHVLHNHGISLNHNTPHSHNSTSHSHTHSHNHTYPPPQNTPHLPM